MAVLDGRADVVKLLLQHGADPNIQGKIIVRMDQYEFRAPLHIAAEMGDQYLDVLNALIDCEETDLDIRSLSDSKHFLGDHLISWWQWSMEVHVLDWNNPKSLQINWDCVMFYCLVREFRLQYFQDNLVILLFSRQTCDEFAFSFQKHKWKKIRKFMWGIFFWFRKNN